MVQCVKIFNKRRHRKCRKKYSRDLKAWIALDAIIGQKTIAELASEYGLHTIQISSWKKQLLESASVAFTVEKDKGTQKKEVECERLYQKVGQLHIEVDSTKKTAWLIQWKLSMSKP